MRQPISAKSVSIRLIRVSILILTVLHPVYVFFASVMQVIKQFIKRPAAK